MFDFKRSEWARPKELANEYGISVNNIYNFWRWSYFDGFKLSDKILFINRKSFADWVASKMAEYL